MHDSQEILKLLARLSLHYPQSGRTAAELAALALDLAEDLAPFPMEVVERGMRCARRECRWFPSTAQLVEFCSRAMGELRRFQQRQALAAPDPDWDENAARGLRWCALILARLDGRGREPGRETGAERGSAQGRPRARSENMNHPKEML